MSNKTMLYTIIIAISFCTLCLASNSIDDKDEKITSYSDSNQEIPIFKELTKHLKDIAKVEIDAYHSCRMAGEAINDLEIRDALRQFQDDHKKNILEIQNEMEEIQNKPVRFNLDFKGFSTRGFSCPTEYEGDTYILMALEDNEVRIIAEYDIIINESIPSYLKKTNYMYSKKIHHSTNILREQLEVERKNLSYIRSKLRQCRSG